MTWRPRFSTLLVAAVVALAVVLTGAALMLSRTAEQSGRTVVNVRLWDQQVASAYRESFETFSAAHPDIEVQVKQNTLKLRARLASREEKTAVWPRCVAAYPPYEAYQKRTTRDIPLFICEKRICDKR
jgi:ABC-type glycerol-3-phosphate transport system substrate-binding protein